jgi:hypothetical protein
MSTLVMMVKFTANWRDTMTALLEVLREECFPNMKDFQVERTVGSFSEDELVQIIQEESLDNGQ